MKQSRVQSNLPRLATLLAALPLTRACPAVGGPPRFIPLGATTGVATSVSDDGLVVAGYARIDGITQAIVWTEAAGFHSIGAFIDSSDAQGISGDGNVVVGESTYTSNLVRSFRSSQAGPPQTMPMLSTGLNNSSWALDASYDGSVIVGQSWGSNGYNPVRWTASGVQALGNLPTTNHGEALGVSGDGSVIVGYSYTPGQFQHPFRWTAATGMQDLGHLGTINQGGIANEVSGDGNVIVGYSYSASGPEAFRWTQATGMVGLGDVPGGSFSSTAWDANHDGSIIVGGSASGTPDSAFVWTQQLGMITLGQYLTMNGVTGFSGWIFYTATAISADGTTILGYGANPSGSQDGFIAVVPLTGSCCTANTCTVTAHADCTGTWSGGAPCGGESPCGLHCGTADFDCDGDLGTDADIESFFACLAGACPALPCISGADFNGDGDLGTDGDIESFFRVLGGGSC